MKLHQRSKGEGCLLLLLEVCP